MPQTTHTAFVNLTASGIVTRQPAYFCCISFTATDSGDYVDVYEGRDATSGRKVVRVKGLANRSQSFNFTYPPLCERGIFLDFSTDDTEATVDYRPVEWDGIRQPPE